MGAFRGQQTWVKGQSGNPTGYSKEVSSAARQLAKRISDKSRQGEELCDFLFDVLRPTPKDEMLEKWGIESEIRIEHKLHVTQILLDRGWGKSVESISLHVDDGTPDSELIAQLISTLTPQELREQADRIEALKLAAAIDVTPSEPEDPR